jgi:HK97 family phage prohead protease
MNYKTSKFEIKEINETDNIIEGYCAYFNNVDSHGDIIERGAFAKTIKENQNRIKVLWQHDIDEPIGKPIFMEEDSKGLYVRAKISMTEDGRDAMILMKDGVVDEMSIGYDVIKDEYKGKNRILKEIRLWEFSPVTFASNDMAKITSAKNFNELLYDLKSTDKNEIKNAIKRLNELLEQYEPTKVTQIKQEDHAVKQILETIRGFKNA